MKKLLLILLIPNFVIGAELLCKGTQTNQSFGEITKSSQEMNISFSETSLTFPYDYSCEYFNDYKMMPAQYKIDKNNIEYVHFGYVDDLQCNNEIKINRNSGKATFRLFWFRENQDFSFYSESDMTCEIAEQKF